MKVYKTVEGPREMVMEKGGNIANTMKYFEDLINAEARNGWRYHSMNTLPIYEKPGCLGALLGNQGTVHNRYLLIFERDE